MTLKNLTAEHRSWQIGGPARIVIFDGCCARPQVTEDLGPTEYARGNHALSVVFSRPMLTAGRAKGKPTCPARYALGTHLLANKGDATFGPSSTDYM